MSVDWAQFVASLRQYFQVGAHPLAMRMAMGGPDDPWKQFRQFAAQSGHAAQLQPLVEVMDSAYVDEVARFRAMISLVALVAPHEWAPAMDTARERHASALQGLLRELDAHRQGTLAACLRGVLDPAFHDFWYVVQIGLRVLQEPCPPGELPHIAELCNIGLQSCLDRLRTALDRSAPSTELSEARVAFLYAHSRYAETARDLNRHSGAALFRDFSPPLSR